MQEETIMAALQSGYARRGEAMLPRQGRGLPWRVLHDPKKDRTMLLKDPVEDSALDFFGARSPRSDLSYAVT
jgi:hypothetical protein